ncbi:MAG: GNAT family protein [Candidatus Aenigmarchaeota archaeon]|nr:GNAT family protein [Candidatus Aenigmarchaeota archaeon]
MIIVRRAKVGDENGMINFVNEQIRKKEWNYTGRNKLKDKNNLKETRKNLLSKKPKTYYFLAFDGKKVIGSVGITPRNNGRLRHRASIGWGVHYNYRGQGIATKLVTTMLVFAKKKRFKRLDAEIAVENIASVKLAKDLGFKIEGHIKKGMLLDDGRYVDTYVVGKLL